MVSGERQPLSCVPSTRRPRLSAPPARRSERDGRRLGPPIKWSCPLYVTSWSGGAQTVPAVNHSPTLNSRIAIGQVCLALSQTSHMYTRPSRSRSPPPIHPWHVATRSSDRWASVSGLLPDPPRPPDFASDIWKVSAVILLPIITLGIRRL